MRSHSEAPAPSRANAAVAGNEDNSPPAVAPHERVDSPRSKLRNALQIVELAYAENRGAHSFGIGQCVVDRKALDQVGQLITDVIVDLTPQLVASDPAQVKLAIEDFRPKQLPMCFDPLRGF